MWMERAKVLCNAGKFTFLALYVTLILISAMSGWEAHPSKCVPLTTEAISPKTESRGGCFLLRRVQE